ncbi:MAG: NAD-dependent epimerase/dehydratase family protein [Phycisphaerales bacterium]
MRILFIGGTGEISYSCVEQARDSGHEVTVFNRGNTSRPTGTRHIAGDMTDDATYRALAVQHFDVVCQFRVFTPSQGERDVRFFSGHTEQYIFISSASAYQKPPTSHVITENTPLINPFAAYSQNKADTEAVLMNAHRQGLLPVTIVRPSHTHRFNFPGTFVAGDHWAWRITHGKPIVIHGDGQSLWTLTHADDFARAFVRLFGNSRSLGEAFHITRDTAHTWEHIFTVIARSLNARLDAAYIPSRTINRCHPDWGWPLLGDKSYSVVFDNSKIHGVIGDWHCLVSLEEGLARAAESVSKRLRNYQPDMDADARIDFLIESQNRVGR